jgi:Protein of unknown function (DUF1579)
MKRWLCTMLVICAVGMIAAAAIAGEEKKAMPKDMKMDAATEQAMPAENMPGPNQDLMKKLAGNFDYALKMWMAPGTAPMESKGKRTGEMVMDGRYLQEKFTGDFMGQPFEGLGTLAYDNVQKKWVSTWIDNASTGIMVSTGTCDGKGTWEMKGEMPDPMSGKMVMTRGVTTLKDDNTIVMSMYVPGPDGKEMKMMEITLTRSM